MRRELERNAATSARKRESEAMRVADRQGR